MKKSSPELLHQPTIAAFADYVALAYHEARNVRHLVKKGHLDKARCRLLTTVMPTDKHEAWKVLERLRREASGAASARETEAVFQRRFDLSLEDLVAISDDSHWSGTQRGGNQWAQIDRVLIELRAAIARTYELLARLPLMPHNTGLLGEKLKSLTDHQDR